MNLDRYRDSYDHIEKKVRIAITQAELRQAFDVALARESMNLARHAEHLIKDTRDGLWQKVKGMVGEMAVSRFLDRPLLALDTLGDYGAPDVKPNVEVRCTTKAGAPLPLYKKDHDPSPFVLAWWNVDKDLGEVWLVGWAFKVDVARPAYWDEVDGCWKIWPAELRPPSELAALQGEMRGLDLMDRVAKWKAKQAERERQGPQPETSAPAASTPADAPAPIEAATPASAGGTPGGMAPTGDDTSLLERDF